MIKCWKYLYTLPKYGELKLYKFSDDEWFETPVDANDISKEEGFFVTKEELEQLQLEAWDAAVEAYRIYTECGERSSFNDYLSSKSKEGKI